MAKYYVVQPYDVSADGAMLPTQAIPANTKVEALAVAENTFKKRGGGVVVFSRSGDPEVGEWEDAIIVKVFGSTPE